MAAESCPRPARWPPIDYTADLTAPLLGLFGNDDTHPSPEQVDLHEAELKRHGKDYEFHRYDGAGARLLLLPHPDVPARARDGRLGEGLQLLPPPPGLRGVAPAGRCGWRPSLIRAARVSGGISVEAGLAEQGSHPGGDGEQPGGGLVLRPGLAGVRAGLGEVAGHARRHLLVQFQGALADLGVGGEFLDDDLANRGGLAEHGGQVPPQRGDGLAQAVIRVGGRGRAGSRPSSRLAWSSRITASSSSIFVLKW